MSTVATLPQKATTSLNFDEQPGFKHIKSWSDAALYGDQIVVFKTDSPFFGRQNGYKIGDLFCGYVIKPSGPHDYVIRSHQIVCGSDSSVPFDERGLPMDPDYPSKRMENRLVLFYNVQAGKTLESEHPCKLSETILKTHGIAMKSATLEQLAHLEDAFQKKEMSFSPNFLNANQTMFAYSRATQMHMRAVADGLNTNLGEEEYGNRVEYFLSRNLRPSDYRTKKTAEGKSE